MKGIIKNLITNLDITLIAEEWVHGSLCILTCVIFMLAVSQALYQLHLFYLTTYMELISILFFVFRQN